MENKNNKPKVATKKHVARLERERQQVRLVRTIAFVMFGVIALLLTYGYIDLNYLQLRKPVAEVNGEKITIKEWRERIQLERVNLLNQYQRAQFFQQNFGMDMSQQLQEVEFYMTTPDMLGRRVADQMIDEALIRQEAERRGISVSDEELEKAIQEAYNFYPNGTSTPTITPTTIQYPTDSPELLTLVPPTGTPTKAPTSTPAPSNTPDPSVSPTATFTAAPPTPTFVPEDITATPTKYTVDLFNTEYQKTVIDFDFYGISESVFRSAFKSDLLRAKLIEAMRAELPTTEEQVWARHILIEEEALAKTVRSKLLNGEDFAEVAKEYSIDTGSAVDGGDLGWFSKGVMVPEFEDAAFSQEIGEINELVKSQFGYHIIQVLGHADLPLTTTQLQQKGESAFSEWLTNIKTDSDITNFSGWLEFMPEMPKFGEEPSTQSE